VPWQVDPAERSSRAGGSSEEVAVLWGGGAAVACGEGGTDVAREEVERERGMGGLISFCSGHRSRGPLLLTPASYVPASVPALRAASSATDADATAALASLIVIILPHILFLQPASASESASTLAAFLSCTDASWLPTGTLRLVVKSLGQLALHLDPVVEENGLDSGGGGEEVAVLRGGYSSCVSHMVCTHECFFAWADGLRA
jgi:hypothetical protein